MSVYSEFFNTTSCRLLSVLKCGFLFSRITTSASTLLSIEISTQDRAHFSFLSQGWLFVEYYSSEHLSLPNQDQFSITIVTVLSQDQPQPRLSLETISLPSHNFWLAYRILEIKILSESSFQALSIDLISVSKACFVRKLFNNKRFCFLVALGSPDIQCSFSLGLILLALCPWHPLGSRTLNSILCCCVTFVLKISLLPANIL